MVMPAADNGLRHLVPEARAAALMSDTDRLALLRTERWWIAHDRAQAALARLDARMSALRYHGPGRRHASTNLNSLRCACCAASAHASW
jgi:hypothetical protein